MRGTDKRRDADAQGQVFGPPSTKQVPASQHILFAQVPDLHASLQTCA